MDLNIAEKPEVAEKFIYFVFFKTKEKRFLVCHFKNTLETLFCTTEESEFVREEIQVTLKNYCWLFLWILAEESHNRRVLSTLQLKMFFFLGHPVGSELSRRGGLVFSN